MLTLSPLHVTLLISPAYTASQTFHRSYLALINRAEVLYGRSPNELRRKQIRFGENAIFFISV